MVLPLVALGTLGALEGGAAMRRLRRRRAVYQLAAARAAELGRPLVVVGDPDGGMHTRMVRAYGCGDVCVDLAGCPACPVAIAADITKPLPFADDSVVVYVSCVLEYVEDVDAALRELRRVAGENLFLVCVEPWTMTATIYPGARWRVADDGTATPVTRPQKAARVGLLGLLCWLAVV